VIASPHFYLYRSNPEFSSRPPDLSRQEFEDEVADLSHDPQVSSLQTAPDQNVQFAVAKFEGDAGADADWLTRDKDNLYLWLVRIDDVRICLENGALGQSTARKRLSHTNLSGVPMLTAVVSCGLETSNPFTLMADQVVTHRGTPTS